MTEYAVLLPGDQDAWRDADAARRREVYDVHRTFMATLAERGHRLTGGAELAHTDGASRTVRQVDGRAVVTEGPYAETAEQLSGFYLVETDDLDDLVEVCAMLADAEGPVEVRDCVADEGSAS